MLTRIQIKNFKQFDNVDIELGKAVVLIGPNNSGKTTALQALALWELGIRRWTEKRVETTSSKRSGVAINRNDLISIPIPSALLLWRDLHVRNMERAEKGATKQTENVRIEIIATGVTDGIEWSCGLEFDYANVESLYCRPLKIDNGEQRRMAMPLEANAVRVAFLPPMSGLAAVEPKWEPGRISVLLGEGQTAQVLRNLCYQLSSPPLTTENWNRLVDDIARLFNVTLLPPQYVKERGEITMTYKESNGIELDLSSSGRGFQQTLLLLAYLYTNPRTVLLLDEPDAHLEVLRQRQIYQLLTEVASANGSQIIAASHSEVVLNEAADRDVVVAFVGKPHRIDDRGGQVIKALKEIGFDQYYQAEQTGWVLYLEGSTDLDILRKFARTLQHRAAILLERPFIHYVGNTPQKARDHFFGIREGKKDLVGIAIFDRLDKELKKDSYLVEAMWKKRELENYLCIEEVLLSYARADEAGDLFVQAEAFRRENVMRESIKEITNALRTLRRDPFSPDVKATDEFLDPLFENYFSQLKLPNLLRKNDYHELAGLVPKEKIDIEIIEKLDEIVKIAAQAKPLKQ